MSRILSGIRPSGKLHLGNYLGAIKNWIELQDRKDAELCVFMIADYHGMTTPFESKKYGEDILNTACEYLAAGIDPEKALLIRQSRVPQHTELAWIFSTLTPVSWLDRLPTYKEQLEKTKLNNLGLLAYPVLMAADILVYKANLVPVGEDQLPHIDITNEIAKRFNSMFGKTFEPVKAHLGEGARIMSLQDPTKKMSKTPSINSGQAGDEYIALTDSPDEIREKIKKAVTDSGEEIKYDLKKKPAISNLITIYQLLSPVPSPSGGATGQAGKKHEEIEAQYQGKSYEEFKKDLAEVVVEFLIPFQERYRKLKTDLDKVEEIMVNSETRARDLTESTLKEAKKKIGLGG